MKKIDFEIVIEQIRYSLIYFLIGVLFGTGISSFLFLIDKRIVETILDVWFRRITFGLKYVGDYKLWFILNNLIALLMIVVALVLIIAMFMKRRRFQISYFRKYERKNPIITLYSLYMVPIGALIINGALISFFLTYVFLNSGIELFSTALMFMMPHGLSELVALVLASSYGLAYVQLIEPFVLKKSWKKIKETSRQFFFSQVTVIFIVIIFVLIVFSGFIEGSLSVLIRG
jgi:hypothetical protein